MITYYCFEIIQDGITVAEGSSTNKDLSHNEACHYAMIYGQDGPVKIKEFIETIDEQI